MVGRASRKRSNKRGRGTGCLPMSDQQVPHEHDDQAHDNREAPREGADVHQLRRVPNVDDMREMVDVLFHYAMRGLIELVWSTPAPGTEERQKLDNAQMVKLDDDNKAGMIEWAASKNAQPNTNCYLAPGLRDEAVVRARSHRGEADVISVPPLWTDCDDPGVYDAALETCESIGMPPSLTVITGEPPHRHGAHYWELSAPGDRSELPRMRT